MNFEEYIGDELLEGSDQKVAAGLKQCVKHLKSAVDELKKVKNEWRTGDVPHFIGLIEEIISTDHGEAGIEPLIKKISKK